MGKKGNWFSAIKKAFSSSSKDSITSNTEKNLIKEKKKHGVGKSKNPEVSSFIPLNREPSSIEKILGEAEREQYFKIHQEHFITQAPHFHQSSPIKPTKKVQNFKEPKQKRIISPYRRVSHSSYVWNSAIKIQAAFRGYMARKNYRTLKGLMRLQKVMRGKCVKRQTMNTMKSMQQFVRIQSQIRARRLSMIESKNLKQQQQTLRRDEREIENSFSRWNSNPNTEDEEWDDSVLTKEEKQTRMQRKVQAVIKRERALAYAYSHQLLKVTPKSAHAVLTDIRSGGSPWWWNWLDRQVPHDHPPRTPPPKPPTQLTPKFTKTTPFAISSTPQAKKHIPSSPKSKHSQTTLWNKRINQSQLSDNESLISCPPFRQVPNYMAPTVSAKAKAREGGDCNESEKKRFSFNNFFTGKESNKEVRRMSSNSSSRGKHRPSNSIGGISVDSTVSLPAGVGRKPFK